MSTSLTDAEIAAIAAGTHPDPETVLGMHSVPYRDRAIVAVRAVVPGAANAYVYDVTRRQRYPMTRCHPAGVFEALFTRRRKHFAYHLEVKNGDHSFHRVAEARMPAPVLPEEDLRRFRDGTHQRAYEVLGSHPARMQGTEGTRFAVWAPNAEAVSVIGDFNDWDRQRHPMRLRPPYGVWECFLPNVRAGARYQYAITTSSGDVLTKIDPYGFHDELHWQNEMSVVADLDAFAWADDAWLRQRDAGDAASRPMSTYEVHLGSWLRVAEDGFRSGSRSGSRFPTYRELADTLIPYVTAMGFTHIELLPVAEHPYYPSWGYQVTGYYAPTSRYGRPEDFMAFIDACHRAGIGVIMDWVPAHFPKDGFSLGHFDGAALYEHEDPRMGEHKDWGTLIFDYGRPEVKNFLLANALFWCDKYHIDGIRVDAVASMLYLDYSRREGEWVPNKYGGRENIDAIAFLKACTEAMRESYPGVMTIAEESTSWLGVTSPTYLGGLGFTLKWNLGWMNDMLHYLAHAPDTRKYVHTMVPFALLYAFHEQFVLELSHDEVVHGKGSLLAKMPGDAWEQCANLRVLFGFMFGHPGKKLLFMGSEFGQRREWNHDAALEWEALDEAPHQGIQAFVRDLNRLYVAEPALHADHLREQGFGWIDYHDFQNSVIVFLRRTAWDDPNPVLFVCNFLPTAHAEYRIGVPQPGWYRELLNSDAAAYGGTGQGNPDGCQTEEIGWHRQACSITLHLPPLSVLAFKRESGAPPQAPQKPGEDALSPHRSGIGRSGTTRSKAESPPKPIVPVVSRWLPGQKRPAIGERPAILDRGQQTAEPAPAAEAERADASRKAAYAGPSTLDEARPQGSKRAILAEDGIHDDEKRSSG